MKKFLFFIFFLLFFSNTDAAFRKKLDRRKRLAEPEFVSDLPRDRSESLTESFSERESDPDPKSELESTDVSRLTVQPGSMLIEAAAPVSTDSEESILLDELSKFEERVSELKNFLVQIKETIGPVVERYNFPKFDFEFDFSDYDYESLKDYIFDQDDKVSFAGFVSGILEQGITEQKDLLSKHSSNVNSLLRFVENRLARKNSLRGYERFGPGYIEKIGLSSVEISNGFKTFCVGDLHGNFEALDKIISDWIEQGILKNNLKVQGKNRIIFLGDFIDRGENSLEISLFLIILKILNPKKVVILAGNHEHFSSFEHYGFLDELKNKLLSVDFSKAVSDIKDSIKNSKLLKKEVFIFKDKILSNMKLKENLDIKNKLSEILKNTNDFSQNVKYAFNVLAKFFNYFPKKIADYFFLQPSALFYKTPKNEFFQFNHAGYVLLTERDLGFLKSEKKYLERDISQFVWNDLSLDDSQDKCFPSRRGVGLECPQNIVFADMIKNNILGKFGGHQHNLPKEINFNKEMVMAEIKDKYGEFTFQQLILDYENLPFFKLLKESSHAFFNSLESSYRKKISDEKLSACGFVELLDNLRSKDLKVFLREYYFKEMVGEHRGAFGACSFAGESLNNYIFILISGMIGLPSAGYNYYPSYLELNIKKDIWIVDGYYLDREGQRKKIIMK